GKTCMKSYEAVRKCNDNNIDNVISYDSGIMEWARTFPRQAILLGSVLKNANRLISNKEFHAHTISPDAFATRMADLDDIVLDVRDAYQREGLSVFVGREHRVLLGEKKRFDSYIKKANKAGKALLIFDAAGKQVRWLHYYLASRGLKKFYFMEGGIRAYYKEMVLDSLYGSG
ncbi:MAG: rhodanese-like domain-containing protein, partial [Thiohalomonadales bacterium]